MINTDTIQKFQDILQNIKIIYPSRQTVEKNMVDYMSVIEITYPCKNDSENIIDNKFYIKTVKFDSFEIDDETLDTIGDANPTLSIIDKRSGVSSTNKNVKTVGDIIDTLKISNSKDDNKDEIFIMKAIIKAIKNIIKSGLPLSAESVSIEAFKIVSKNKRLSKNSIEDIIAFNMIIRTILYKLKKAYMPVMTDDEFDEPENIEIILQSYVEIKESDNKIKGIMNKYINCKDSHMNSIVYNTILNLYSLSGISYTYSPDEYLKELEKELNANSTEKSEPLMYITNCIRSILIKIS